MGVLASTVMAAALRPPRAYERRMRELQVLPIC